MWFCGGEERLGDVEMLAHAHREQRVPVALVA
jgi:hypothetical protein